MADAGGKKRHLALYACDAVNHGATRIFRSTRADFLNVYPFYRGAALASPGAVVAWELAYGVQFIALEFFFRGFLVLGLERYIGRYSVWVAVVPYCMIHFHKPPLEAFAAILAGIVLGEVARRTRSIMGGALVHLSVALSMDAWRSVGCALSAVRHPFFFCERSAGRRQSFHPWFCL